MSPAERLRSRLALRPKSEAPNSKSEKAESAPISDFGFRISDFGSDTTADTVLIQQPKRPLAIGIVRQVRHRRWGLKEMERRWYHCLFYPIGAWPLVLGLAIVLTAWSGGSVLALPGLLSEVRAEGSWLLWACLFSLPPFLILGYVSGFLDCALTSALTGELRGIRWPGRDIGIALKSGARWLICFVAGPVVPAAAGVVFWIYGGDLLFWDWIILAEINILAISWWFLLVWAVNEKDRLRDLHPVRVGEFIHRRGHRLVALAVFASVLVLAHAWLASAALQKVHDDAALGWLLLWLCWVSGMFFATFLFRWAGVWLYWDRIRATEERLLAEGDILSSNGFDDEQATNAQKRAKRAP